LRWGTLNQLQIPRVRRLVMKAKSKSPLKPKEGLNGAPVNQSWSQEFVYTNKTRARAPAPLKTADPSRARRARDDK